MARSTRRGTRTSAERRRSTCVSATAARLASTIHPHGSTIDRHAAPAAGGKEAVEPSGRTNAGRLRSSYRLLVMRGLSRTEAGNVVAYTAGLHAVESGWSVKQVEQLVALRSLVECGVITR